MTPDEGKRTLCAYYAGIERKNVEWLWYPYIPVGKLTVLQGDPGEGKSTFMLQLTALLTTGGMLPDSSGKTGPVNVIYQCAEDDPADTIKPRLVDAGADCSRVAYVIEHGDDLTVDDERIERSIREVGAKLLILDPIQAFMGRSADMQNAVATRNTMRQLAKVAERQHCAIVLIGHMNKESTGKKLYRGLGSIDLAAIARSVLMIERDPENSDIRYMLPIKSSLAPEGKAIAFTFGNGQGFQWLGACTPPTIHKQSRHEKASSYLRLLLSGRDLSAATALERMQAIGVSERTVRTIVKELGVDSYRKDNAWYWRLVDHDEIPED